MNNVSPINKCLKLMAEIEQLNLYRPSEEDQALLKLKDLAMSFANLDDEGRQQARAGLSDNLCWNLLNLSCTAAEMAIHTGDASWIHAGITAHIIEDFRIDQRENIRRLVLIDYACGFINVELKDVVTKLNYTAGERARKELLDFCGRSPEINNPAMFGIKVENKDGKVRFVPLAG